MNFTENITDDSNLEGFDGVKKGLKNGSIKKPNGISFEDIDDRKLNSVPSKDEISLE